MKLEIVAPDAIEAKSFAIITKELGDRQPKPLLAPIVKRVIHTTADFDYAQNLYFTDDFSDQAMQALIQGADIVCDTNMAKSGVNKSALKKLGCEVHCFIADPDVAQTAKEKGSTRACASMEKAARILGCRPIIFAIGNAPTALVRLLELIGEGKLDPAIIIGVPVGFVNVVESKEMLINSGRSCVAAKGRKGGSNVAAAICNALLYMALERHKSIQERDIL